MKYPDYIMQYVRQNLGLDKDDTSLDNEILQMSKDEVFNRVCTWNGLVGWSGFIRRWIQDIYKIDLNKEIHYGK